MDRAELPAAPPPTVMLVVGEPSGDALGAELIAGIRRLRPDARLIGVGGTLMAANGFISLYPLGDTAVMGIKEVVPALPRIFRRVHEVAALALVAKPDLVVVIDSPDFTRMVARRIKRANPAQKIAKYVAPQVWASRPWRARTMRAYYDHVLTLLPFEPKFFESVGLPATFVGHPVVERAEQIRGGAALRDRLGIAPGTPLLATLFGSRTNEFRFLHEPFREAVARIAPSVPGLVCLMPTVPHLEARVRALAANWPVPSHVFTLPQDKFAAFDTADAALAASGTVTTELALAGVPTVVCYRVGWLTSAIFRWLVNVPHITLVNLIAEARIMPELVQENCTPEKIAAELLPLLTDEAAADAQRQAFANVASQLGRGGEKPSLRAARKVLDLAGVH